MEQKNPLKRGVQAPQPADGKAKMPFAPADIRNKGALADGVGSAIVKVLLLEGGAQLLFRAMNAKQMDGGKMAFDRETKMDLMHELQSEEVAAALADKADGGIAAQNLRILAAADCDISVICNSILGRMGEQGTDAKPRFAASDIEMKMSDMELSFWMTKIDGGTLLAKAIRQNRVSIPAVESMLLSAEFAMIYASPPGGKKRQLMYNLSDMLLASKIIFGGANDEYEQRVCNTIRQKILRPPICDPGG